MVEYLQELCKPLCIHLAMTQTSKPRELPSRELPEGARQQGSGR